MNILCIETSTEVCSVGISSDGHFHSAKSISESHIHSEKILTLIQDVCNEQRINLSHLDAVAVSVGPGSFTGLRIGMSTAKGLCVALGKSLVTVPTFEAIAYKAFQLYPAIEKVKIFIDAKQGDYYVGEYIRKEMYFESVCSVHIGQLKLLDDINPQICMILTDNIQLLENLEQKSLNVKNVLPLCRGDAIAFLAKSRITSVENQMWENKEPIYLKDFIVRSRT